MLNLLAENGNSQNIFIAFWKAVITVANAPIIFTVEIPQCTAVFKYELTTSAIMLTRPMYPNNLRRD